MYLKKGRQEREKRQKKKNMAPLLRAPEIAAAKGARPLQDQMARCRYSPKHNGQPPGNSKKGWREEHPAPPTPQKAPKWTSQPWASGVLCKECFAIFAFLTHSLGAKDSRAQRLKRKTTKKRRKRPINVVFIVQGGCGRECDAFLKQLSEKIAKKSG